MHLYFLRHGKAEARGDWHKADALRPLTAEGERLVAAEARAIGRLTPGLEVIVTSPLARARRTAEIVADALGLRDVLVDDERLGHGLDARVLARVDVRGPGLDGGVLAWLLTPAQLAGE